MTEEQLRVRELIAQDQLGGWDEAWQESVTPWDAGQSQPPLRDLLMSDLVALPRSGRALVPGCGRGYDAILIASSLSLDTTGLDISAAAVAAANAYAESSQLSERTKVKFGVRNFFALSPSPDERYDLIYDYTFFVSGGFLIILVWPIVDRPEGVGPPFFVRPEHYTLALGDGWDKILDQAPQNSVEAHKDKERFLVFRRL
ncbi:thiol methyltransferase 1 [Wolfiporia cocos MD-104 SS10]|uniref:Thiol methyltransferase 1 n=1 Tax=Wolfiporia cocos (strain MD-104) TaxID=742152 RepID=A0A2H3IWK9_WOLCO|nr:thiol methyltransferase 1 [Wolfiporia cocos MD-104 SS10]